MSPAIQKHSSVCQTLRFQPMRGRNRYKSGNSHVHPHLQERLLLIIYNCTCDPRFAYPKYRASCCCYTLNVSFTIKEDTGELSKQNVTVTGVAVATMRFLCRRCNYTVDSDVSTGDFSLVLDILHGCEHKNYKYLLLLCPNH